LIFLRGRVSMFDVELISR